VGERIVVEQVSKAFPGRGQALEDVSFEVEPGAVLVLLGPSGSGKTTLLRCIAGIERISRGRLSIGGAVVAEGSSHVPPEQRNISMVFQDYALWPHMTARDNVAFALKRQKVRRRFREARAAEMLERVGLGHLGSRYPSELSGGEQQRVALARALIGGTGAVLCDEPLSSLDADLKERMRIEIATLVRQANATTIYITHDQAEAFALADLVGVLEAGRLVQLAKPEAIYEAPSSAFVARFTGLAGELAVRIKARLGEGVVAVEAMTRSARRRISARIGTVAPASGEGLLCIRPTAVQLCSPDGEDYHLAGIVADVAFRGRGYEHAVILEDGASIQGVFCDVRIERGRPVGLRLAQAGCVVFPVGAHSSSAAPAKAEANASAAGGCGIAAPLAERAALRG
jgi:iron(III) transport system ATP-binding protein